MKRFCIFLLLPLFIFACGGGGGDNSSSSLARDACGVLGLNTKVINGSQCSDSNSPIARILVINQDDTSNICSGTVIGDKHILSAAHCFIITDVRSVLVEVAGVVFFAPFISVPEDVGIDEQNSSVLNDLAVVEVERSIGVTPVPIAISKDVKKGSVVSIFGFGLDENGETDNLKSGQMLVSRVTDSHIYAKFDVEQGSNTCNGDSGGPAIFNEKISDDLEVKGIVGVVSSGVSGTNCQAGDITLFTNLQTTGAIDFIAALVPDLGLS